MTPVYLDGIGLRAPGLDGWHNSSAVLRGVLPYRTLPLALATPQQLPANEKRRVTALVKLALNAAEEALRHSTLAGGALYSVLASASGDMAVIDRICTALIMPERAVSPTLFHNSVHNTPAGYWTIANQCRLPSTSLSAYDDSFGAGLVEAVTVSQAERTPVLLIAYDYPPPPPLATARPITAPFGTALLLSPRPTPASLARLTLSFDATDSAIDRLAEPALERLRVANPAARSLPLLQAVARRAERRITLPYPAAARLVVTLEPLSEATRP